MGKPAEGYPWNWSVYRWFDGVPASTVRIADLTEFAVALAHFLVCLQRIDPTGGPPPGPHNFPAAGRWKPTTLRPATRSQPCRS